MAFFTDFINDYRQLQNESEAVRGIGTPTSQQLGGLSSGYSGQAMAETSARSSQLGLEQRSRELESSKLRSADRLSLASRGLDEEEDALSRSKKIFPWTAGLGATGILFSYLGGRQQKSRDEEYEKMLNKILIGRNVEKPSGGTYKDPYSYMET